MGGFREFILGVVLGIFVGFVFVNSGASNLITGGAILEEQERPQVIRETVREIVKERGSSGLSCDDKISLVKSEIEQLKNELKKVNGNLVTAQIGARVSQLGQGDAEQDISEMENLREQVNKFGVRIDELNTEFTDLILNCKGTLA